MRKNISQNMSFLAGAIFACGLGFSLYQYMLNRSLWLDEALLALNVVERSFLEIFKPLDFNQAAPIGFLVVVKLLTMLLGASEYVLRLVPFFSRIASLVLFYYLARRLLHPFAFLFTLAVFAFSQTLTQYATEFKPYSSDLLAALILYLIGLRIYDRGLTKNNLWLYGILGSALILFSYPSVFIIGGLSASFFFYFLKKKDFMSFQRLMMITLVHLVSFIILFKFFATHAIHSIYLKRFFGGPIGNGFVPTSSLMGSALWTKEAFYKLYDYFVSVAIPKKMMILPVLGGIYYYFKNPFYFFILTLPVGGALIASALKLYPFSDRLTLFLVPSFFFLFGGGFSFILKFLERRRFLIVLGGTVMTLVFMLFFYQAMPQLLKPIARQEIKPSIQYFKSNLMAGDVLYLYSGSQPAFRYYSKQFGIDYDVLGSPVWAITSDGGPVVRVLAPRISIINGISPRASWERYLHDLDQLKGKARVWILFSHAGNYPIEKVNSEAKTIEYLDTIGRRKDSFVSFGTGIYLYDFS